MKIPATWIWTTIKEICTPPVTKRPTGETFRYIDIDAIDNKQHIVHAPKTLLVEQAPSRAARDVAFGDTLFSMVRPYLENIAFITKNLADCIASTGFYVCRPKQSVVNPRYLYYFLTSQYAIDGLNNYMRGDNSPSIRANELEDFSVPLPPLAEQQRIVISIEIALEQLKEITANIS